MDRTSLSALYGISANKRQKLYDKMYMIYTEDYQVFDDENIYVETELIENYIKLPIDIDAALVLNKDIEIVSQEDVLKKQIDNIMWRNKVDNKMHECLHNSILFGDMFVKIEDNEGKAIIKPISPYFVKELRKNEYDKIDMIELEYYLKEKYEEEGKIKEKNVLYKELYTEENFIITKAGEVIENKKNELGFVPFAHLKSQVSLEDSIWGRSFVLDLYETIKNIAELQTIYKTIIKKYADPINIVYTDGESQKKLANELPNMIMDIRRGINWLLFPLNAKVETRKMGELPEGFESFLNSLKTNLRENIPEYCLTDIVGTSDINGIGLKIQTFKLQPKIRQLQKNLKFFIEDIIDMCLMIENKFNGEVEIDTFKYEVVLEDFFDFEKYGRKQTKQTDISQLINIQEKFNLYTEEEFKQKIEEINNPKKYGILEDI